MSLSVCRSDRLSSVESVGLSFCRSDVLTTESLQVGRVCSRRFVRSPEPPLKNLSESIRLAFFGHVRSYILIVRRDERASLYIPRDLSRLFGGAARHGTEIQNLSEFMRRYCLLHIFTEIYPFPRIVA